MRANHERILLVGDAGRDVESALAASMPAARVTAVASYFDAIAELSAAAVASGKGNPDGPYTAILASAEPIERRPEPAVRTLRQLAGSRRLVLFGHPTLEPLSRKMLEFGCDDYVVCPPSVAELQKVLAKPPLRLSPPDAGEAAAPAGPTPRVENAPTAAPPSPSLQPLQSLDLAEVMLEALAQHPSTAPAACAKQINARIGPSMALVYTPAGKPAPDARPGKALLTESIGAAVAGADGAQSPTPSLHLFVNAGDGSDQSSAGPFLSRLAGLFAKVVALQERHNGLQKLAITDQLTGAYNRRYFEHFLQRILERARTIRFGVTLLLFDIDDFKKYNDQFGHGLGDEILRETAAAMNRCCREHDLVARIGGDEFAVVFWDKEGPRQPKDPARPPAYSAHGPRTQQPGPRQVFDRFRKLISTRQFEALGPAGRGQLSISGGFADFPWDGRDMSELIAAADKDLMFGAKKDKQKNQMLLVGEGDDGGAAPAD